MSLTANLTQCDPSLLPSVAAAWELNPVAAVDVDMAIGTIVKPINATMAGVGALTASLMGAGALSDTMAGAGHLTASLTGSGSLSDTMAGVGALTATLTGAGALADTMSAIGGLSAGFGAVASTMAGVGTLSASLAGLAPPWTSAAIGGLSATLLGQGFLSLVANAVGALVAITLPPVGSITVMVPSFPLIPVMGASSPE